jgi:hypothetical protein
MTEQNKNIKDSQPSPEEAYVFWGDDAISREKATKVSGEALEEYGFIHSAKANRYRSDYSGLDTSTDGRPGLTRSDYDYFRDHERVPTKIKNILSKADDIYQRVGLVKNVIDLMGDFASQGIRLVHKVKKTERFYQEWFRRVNGKDRSERFLNNLYKSGNIVINRQTGKLSSKSIDQMYAANAAADINLVSIDTPVPAREIPWIYTFIDPVFVDVAGGSAASFVKNKKYELTLPASLRKMIKNPKTEAAKEIINNLPTAIVEAAESKSKYPLDPNTTLVFHYKKDDWQSWAYPMIYAIMDDITVIEKLKLADMAALDGAISNIRIFKLGNLEHRIAPTKSATAKLAQILGNNVGGGTMDLVWGPDIELIESRTSVHQFLGEGKYTPHLNSVYAGLGIPPTLTGTFGAAGTTNNFISLKTLTQRLQYGRDVLAKFWENEMRIVQKAMGFPSPASIEFDKMDLSNEDSEKALLIQLADRNIISEEVLKTRFGFNDEMEKTRVKREDKARKSKKMPSKTGPFSDNAFDTSLKKIALQLGLATPSEVGLDLMPKKNGEKSTLELKQQFEPKKEKTVTGVPGQGRPRNSKDSQTRKDRKFAPQTGASMMIWATKAQDDIAKTLNPILLEFYQKKNLRSLSNEEYEELDNIKTKVLFSINPYTKITADLVKEGLSKINTSSINSSMSLYKKWQYDLKAKINSEMSIDDQKQAKAIFYSLVYRELGATPEK